MPLPKVMLAPVLLGEGNVEPRPVFLDRFDMDSETGEFHGVIEVVDGRDPDAPREATDSCVCAELGLDTIDDTDSCIVDGPLNVLNDANYRVKTWSLVGDRDEKTHLNVAWEVPRGDGTSAGYMVQLVAEYDMARPEGARLMSLRIGGEPVDPRRAYRVAAVSFLAEGGDLYSTFEGVEWLEHDERHIGDVLIDWFRQQPGPVRPPASGRLVPVRE